MRLKRKQRLLLASISAEKIVIRREQPGAAGKLQRPFSERFRYSDFRFERPAVRADVNEAARVVLPGRNDYREACADKRFAFERCEFFRFHRRTAGQHLRYSDAHVAKPGTRNFALFFKDGSLYFAVNVRNENADVCLSPGKTERRGITERGRIKTDADIAQWKRRIGENVAALVSICEDDRLRPDRRARISARFNFLRSGSFTKDDNEERHQQKIPEDRFSALNFIIHVGSFKDFRHA